MGERLTETFLHLFCEKNSDQSKTLRLKGNELQQRIGQRLQADDMESVCDFLIDNPGVHSLNLAYNEIGDDGLEVLINRILGRRNGIEVLNIGQCNLTCEAFRQMYLISRREKMKLKTLRLFGNDLGEQGVYCVALMLKHCPLLEYLDIGYTNASAASVDNLFYELYRTNFKVINFSRVVPYSVAGLYDSQFLAESIHELLRLNNSIVELHARCCGISGHDIELLVVGLYRNDSLRFLDIGHNRIHDFGCEILGKWLKSRPKLIALNIAGNALTVKGAIALSYTLPFSRVRYLDISDNSINDFGLATILVSIKKKVQLRFLLMWGNEIGFKSTRLLQDKLRSGVLVQDQIDVKLYCVDGVLQAAFYQTDHFNHRYFNVMDHGCAVELKIKRNRIEKEGDKPRALVRFEHIDRYPPLDPTCVPKLEQH